MTDTIRVTIELELYVDDADALSEAAYERMSSSWSSEEDFPYNAAGDVPLGEAVHSVLADSIPNDLPGCRRSQLRVEAEEAGSSDESDADSADDSDADSAGETDNIDNTDTNDAAKGSDNEENDSGDSRGSGDADDADRDDDNTAADADGHDKDEHDAKKSND